MGLQSQPVRMQTLRLSFLRMPSVLLRRAVVTEPLQSIAEFVGTGALSLVRRTGSKKVQILIFRALSGLARPTPIWAIQPTHGAASAALRPEQRRQQTLQTSPEVGPTAGPWSSPFPPPLPSSSRRQAESCSDFDSPPQPRDGPWGATAAMKEQGGGARKDPGQEAEGLSP